MKIQWGAYDSDHVRRIVEYIRQADFVFGCMFLFTHPDIINALKGKNHKIVVDAEGYDKSMKTLLQQLPTNGEWRGYCHERLHMKMLIFCRGDISWVYHGSFNATVSGANGNDLMTTEILEERIQSYIDIFNRYWRRSVLLSQLQLPSMKRFKGAKRKKSVAPEIVPLQIADRKLDAAAQKYYDRQQTRKQMQQDYEEDRDRFLQLLDRHGPTINTTNFVISKRETHQFVKEREAYERTLITLYVKKRRR